MRVLVTGATGFLGSWVVRELLERGLGVRALVRATSPLENVKALPIERVQGDVLDRSSVARALEGCDAVIHTAGVVHFRSSGLEELYAVNVGGVETVLGAALEAGVRRAVLTSSTAVMGGTSRPLVLDESSPSNAEALGIDYFVSKLRGERAAMDLLRRGLDVCAVRPSVVIGPGDIHRSSAGLVLGIARGSFPLYVEGGASLCDVRDVAAGHVEALLRGRAGEAYILGGHNLTTDELMRRVAQIAGAKPPRRVPYGVAAALAAATEVLDRARGRASRLPRQLLRSSHLYTFVSSAKAQSQLGYVPRPLETSLRDTLRWFIERGMLEPRSAELRALAGSSVPHPGTVA